MRKTYAGHPQSTAQRHQYRMAPNSLQLRNCTHRHTSLCNTHLLIKRSARFVPCFQPHCLPRPRLHPLTHCPSCQVNVHVYEPRPQGNSPTRRNRDNMSSPLGYSLLGACTFCASQHGADDCDTKGLPLTANSINILGRFQRLKTLSHPGLCMYLNLIKCRNGL